MTFGARLKLLLGLALAGVAPLPAQISESFDHSRVDLPGVPANHVLDEAELFKRQPERMEEISQRLLALKDAHDLPVYVVIYTGLLRETAAERSKALYDVWVGGEHDGMVVVCDTDSKALELALPALSFHDVENETYRMTRLPDYRMLPILAEIRAEVDGEEDGIEYIDRMTKILSLRLDALLAEKPGGVTDGSSIKLAAVTLVIGVVLALAGLFAFRQMKEFEDKARAKFYFPDVMVGSRLGAQFCGGRQSVVEFSKQDPPAK